MNIHLLEETAALVATFALGQEPPDHADRTALLQLIMVLEKADPGAALVFQGVVLALRGDAQGALRHHEDDLREQGPVQEVFLRRAASLRLLEREEEALAMARKAVESGRELPLEAIKREIGFAPELSVEECYGAACASGGMADWDREEEDEAWRHLQ